MASALYYKIKSNKNMLLMVIGLMASFFHSMSNDFNGSHYEHRVLFSFLFFFNLSSVYSVFCSSPLVI